MCLTTKATTHAEATASALKKRNSAPAKTSTGSTMKKSMSDTNLFGLVDFDETEAEDSFYIPGDSDSEASSEEDTLGMIAPVDDDDDLDDGIDVAVVDKVPDIPTPKSIKKTVSFGNLEELSFPVVQGDPNFEMAYPMTLGWECLDESSCSIDEYEETRRGVRRTSEELRTMSEDRRKIIKNSKKAVRNKEQSDRRRGLQRRNSMANGMMFGRDKRRNRVQEFLGRMSSKLSSNSNSSVGSGSAVRR